MSSDFPQCPNPSLADLMTVSNEANRTLDDQKMLKKTQPIGYHRFRRLQVGFRAWDGKYDAYMFGLGVHCSGLHWVAVD